ncbi:hypothetical protein P691DRAFT_648490, partial [Macrolepiota fuliginosa MF-IS2]
PESTPWDSLTPSAGEWRVQNMWAKGLLVYNTKNPIGLGINILGTVAEAWTSYTKAYKTSSDIAHQKAEQELHNTTYSDNDDFPNHIAFLCTKWVYTNSLGASISDNAFKTIVLNSLPHSWDPAVAALYGNQNSVDAISQLNVWWTCISRNCVANPNSSITALQVNGPNCKPQSLLTCSNPNYNRCGHTINVCYWLGRGKEGQLP